MEGTEPEVTPVPAGWTSPIEGYFLNELALRGLTGAARTYRLERDAWEQAYGELFDMSAAFQAETQERILGLNEQLDAERSAWGKEVRRARSFGFGVFAGAGIVPGGFEPVVGAGIVWRIF